MTSRLTRTLHACIYAYATLATGCQRFDPTFAKSDKVMPKDGWTVAMDGTVIDETLFELPLTVQESQGRRVLVGHARKGWVDSRQLLSLDEAPPYYTDLINNKPDYAWAYACRAIAWQYAGNLDRALTDAEERLRLEPDAAAYNSRGSFYLRKNEYEKALDDFNQAIRLHPNFSAAYNHRGLLHSFRRDYDRAISDYTIAIGIDPLNAIAFNNRSLAWCHKQDYARAIDDATAAIQLDSKYVAAFEARGVARCANDEYRQAIVDFEAAIRIDSKAAPIYNRLAWLLATCPDNQFRDGRRAIEIATTACRLTDWADPYSVGTLAASYAETGNFELAKKYQQESIKLANDDVFKENGREHMKLYDAGRPYRENANVSSP